MGAGSLACHGAGRSVERGVGPAEATPAEVRYAWRPLGRPPQDHQRDPVPAAHRGAMAGSACAFRSVEDRVRATSTLVGGRHVGQDLRRSPGRRRRGRPDRLVDGERRFNLLPGPPARRRGSQESAAGLRRRQIRHTIPEPKNQRANRQARGSKGGRPVGFDKTIYKRRNEVERTINAIKNFRAVATRLDKARLRLPRHRHCRRDPALAPFVTRRTSGRAHSRTRSGGCRPGRLRCRQFQ